MPVEAVLSPEDFAVIRGRLSEFCGILLPDHTKYLVERRLRDRLRELGLRSYDQYMLRFVSRSEAEAELGAAIDLLTTNETYFFRQSGQLFAFRDDALPQLLDGATRDDRRLRLWSAGCSSGEEPYSLAILAAEAAPRSGAFEVMGNDISQSVLATAESGRYGPSSFRVVPPRYGRYFSEGGDPKEVRSDIRAHCSFLHLNLLDPQIHEAIGTVDVVFCRNVLIYLADEARPRIVDALFDRLRPGGLLFLGHAESLLNTPTRFEAIQVGGEIAYRRPREDAR